MKTEEDIAGAWNPTKIMNDRFFGKKIGLLQVTCDLLVGPKIQLGGFFMKVKEEDLRRELLKAINGEDSWNRVRPSQQPSRWI